MNFPNGQCKLCKGQLTVNLERMTPHCPRCSPSVTIWPGEEGKICTKDCNQYQCDRKKVNCLLKRR